MGVPVKAMLLALCGLASTAAFAQEKVTLKLADTLPTTHYLSVEGARWFMARATELSGGRLKFEYFPSEQLGKARDLLRLVQTGVTDIAYVTPSYVSDKMPLSGVAELPLLVTSACQGTHAFYAMAHDGTLAKREFATNGVLPLMAWSIGPYNISTRKPALSSLDDLRGLKIRGSGGTWDLTLRAIGAVPVNFPPPEVREALERGTIDGSVGPAISLKPYDLLSVTHSSTRGLSFGSIAFTYSMGLRRFRALPPDLQAALTQAGREADEHLCRYIDEHEAQAQTEAAAAGMTFWTIQGEQKDKIDALLRPVIDQWARDLEARNLPGTALVAEFKAAEK